MADDFGVKFLGSVPIDPQFLMMIETGRRPRYPAGTHVNGQDMSAPAGETDGQEPGSEGREPGLLVEKYQSCSLAPVFKTITADVITAVQQALAAS